MWVRGAAIGTTLLAGLSAAWAESRAPADAPAKFAAVDSSGRVSLVPAASSGDVIGRPAADAPLCRGSAVLPSEEARALVARVAEQEKFYPDFVLSVAKIESRYRSDALSDKGAYGLMQLTPATAARFKVDLCDPEANVRGGVRFLRLLHERFHNPLFILAAYNSGEDAVQKSRGVPPYPETVRFVADVLNDFYAWPDSRPDARAVSAGGRAARSAAREASTLIEPASDPAASPPAPSAKTASRPPWSDGFVMHVE
jgi:soluble lytic murein transglycosylase-like protein